MYVIISSYRIPVSKLLFQVYNVQLEYWVSALSYFPCINLQSNKKLKKGKKSQKKLKKFAVDHRGWRLFPDAPKSLGKGEEEGAGGEDNKRINLPINDDSLEEDFLIL